VICSENSVLSGTCEQVFGPGSSQRISKWNGGGIETRSGVEYVKSVICERQPEVVRLSPECGPFSPIQHHMRDDRQRKWPSLRNVRKPRNSMSLCVRSVVFLTRWAFHL
jgi:hypothetical protein